MFVNPSSAFEMPAINQHESFSTYQLNLSSRSGGEDFSAIRGSDQDYEFKNNEEAPVEQIDVP